MEHKFNRKIPYLTFPSTWEIQPVPQFAGSYWRFYVRRRGGNYDGVSVYLDVADKLGYMGAPYWEIYPAAGGDTCRFLLGQEEQLMTALEDAIKAQEEI
jgi:hypothetical protein